MPWRRRSLLRALAEDRLGRLAIAGHSVLEIGGRKSGSHESLFRAARCGRYVAVGYEGHVVGDLRANRVPFRDGTFDLVLISMVLMYLESGSSASNVLGECHRILRPGGRVAILEPFLYPETPHHAIGDLSRLTSTGILLALAASGFKEPRCEKLGGIFAGLAAGAGDLLPGAIWPVRMALEGLAMRIDAASGSLPYFRRRNERHYQGYFATAAKGADEW